MQGNFLIDHRAKVGVITIALFMHFVTEQTEEMVVLVVLRPGPPALVGEPPFVGGPRLCHEVIQISPQALPWAVCGHGTQRQDLFGDMAGVVFHDGEQQRLHFISQLIINPAHLPAVDHAYYRSGHQHEIPRMRISMVETISEDHLQIHVRPVTSELRQILARVLQRLDVAAQAGLDEGARGTGAAVDAGQRLTVMADQRTNSLMLRTSSNARAALARNLIKKLDQPTRTPGNVWVVYLKNAEASKLAKTLQAILTNNPNITQNASGGLSNSSSSNLSTVNNSASSSSTTSATGTGTSTGTSSGSTGQLSAASGTTDSQSNGIVQADTSTNSLIITAPEPIYKNLRSIIEKLDVRRAQVFVESLIVEVSSDKAAEFGIQFQGLSGANGTDPKVIGGTNFNDSGSGKNILGAAANLGAIGRGLNIGIIDGQVNIPGVGTISNLGFLARALESKANANILSTPNILTLDNEEAKIVIGQNVPFITGQFTNASSGGASVNPFQTIERRDVGLTLRVKPQVSEGGVVKLGIFQEVSSVADTTNVSGVVTNKRSIESNVLVENGNIIVLGGLVEDRVTGNEEKVPGLGDVPGLGWLFKNRDQAQRNAKLAQARIAERKAKMDQTFRGIRPASRD